MDRFLLALLVVVVVGRMLQARHYHREAVALFDAFATMVGDLFDK